MSSVSFTAFAASLAHDLARIYVSYYEHRGALRGTPGSAYPQPEPNVTELPSSALGRPESIKLQTSVPSPTPTRAEEHIATAPGCGPAGHRAFAYADTR